MPNQQEEKVTAILAIHDHHTTKEDVVGIGQSRFCIDLGLRLVENGFCILAPDSPLSEDFNVEGLIAMNPIMFETRITGLCISYFQNLLKYLCSLPFAGPKRVDYIRWSMGGGLPCTFRRWARE